MKRAARHHRQANGLAAVTLAAMACGFTGTVAQAQSDDLVAAAGRGDVPAVIALLRAGADVNEAKSKTLTVKFSGPQETVLGPTTALMEASSKGHLEVVQALLAAKADVNATRGHNSKEGVTALALASRNGHLNVVQALLAAKADVNAGSIPALYNATAAGNLDIVRVLLAAKPDLNWRDPMLGSTVLMLALAPHGTVLRNGLNPADRWDIAQLLLEAGADVNVKTTTGVTALMMVVQGNSSRSLAMVQVLLAAHADVNGGCDCAGNMFPIGSASHARAIGYTALGLAASTGSAEVVQALLDTNAQRAANPSLVVNAKQPGGNTPLTLASVRGRSDVVRLLLAAKADVNAADNAGKTALMLALENDHAEVAELLRSAVAALPGQR